MTGKTYTYRILERIDGVRLPGFEDEPSSAWIDRGEVVAVSPRQARTGYMIDHSRTEAAVLAAVRPGNWGEDTMRVVTSVEVVGTPPSRKKAKPKPARKGS